MRVIIYIYEGFWVLNAISKHSFVERFNAAVEQGALADPHGRRAHKKHPFFAKFLALK